MGIYRFVLYILWDICDVLGFRYRIFVFIDILENIYGVFIVC